MGKNPNESKALLPEPQDVPEAGEIAPDAIEHLVLPCDLHIEKCIFYIHIIYIYMYLYLYLSCIYILIPIWFRA